MGELPEKSFGLQLKANPLEWLISADLPIVFQILKVEDKVIHMKWGQRISEKSGSWEFGKNKKGLAHDEKSHSQ